MPKVKPFRGSTPPLPPPIVIKDVPYPVAKNPDETKSSVAAEAQAPVKDEPKPHYY